MRLYAPLSVDKKMSPHDEGSCFLVLSGNANGLCFFFYPVLETLEHGSGIIGSFAQRIKNAVSHFQRGFERLFLAAVLAVGKILGKLIPFAADAQSPALE